MEIKRTPALPPKKAGFVPTEGATSSPNVVYDPIAKRPKFVKGNQLWQTITGQGIKAIITDPAELWQKAINYFEWCDNNPQARAEVIKHQGTGELIDVPLGRPYSMDGLTIMSGVSGSYFRSRKSELADKIEAKTATPQEYELLDMIHLIENIIRNQRFEGAAVGIFKENLISRIDGYADHINQNNTGEVRQNIVVRDQATADNLKALDKML